MSGEDQQGWRGFAVSAAETKDTRHAWRYISSIILAAFFWAAPVAAGISPAAYRDIGVFAPHDARLPLDAVVTDEAGRRLTLAKLVSRTSVLVFADFTCTTLCGPIVEFAASALEKSGLDPASQFRLIVIGLDPKDRTTDAGRMKRDHVDGNAELEAAVSFVTADEPTIRRLTSALGYRYTYDAEHDQFIHPGAAYVLRADGRVSRVLTGLGLSGGDMRLALVEAGEGHIGTFGDEIRLLCSGFDPEHGGYNLLIGRMLAGATLATILTLGGSIGLLMLAGRRRTA
jgi:protein SCO1/2